MMSTLQSPTIIEPALLDSSEAQRYLGGISRSTLQLLRDRLEIETVHVRRRIMFSRASLDAYIRRQAEAAR
jgi:Helix-turn-helix domain